MSCGGDGKKSTSFLPKASGQAGEVLLVMDTSLRNSGLGEALRQTFEGSAPGLPRPEPRFTVRHIDPNAFNSVLKSATNIIIVATLDLNTTASQRVKGYFTPGSLKTINEDPNRFMFANKDEFARGQQVLYLFGKEAAVLQGHVENNMERLRAFFDNKEAARLLTTLYKANEGVGISNQMKKDHGCSIRIPNGYQLVLTEPGFMWMRNPGGEIDRNLFVAYKPYFSQEEFKHEQIIAFRNEIAREYLFDDPEISDSYVVTETENIPPISSEMTFLEGFGVETKGLWKTNNYSMGGPFLSYTFVDEENGRLFYIEGFLYSPGKDQRELMREMEVVLKTFKFDVEPEPAAKQAADA